MEEESFVVEAMLTLVSNGLSKLRYITFKKCSGDWNQIYCVVTSICVFRFVYTLPLRRNSEFKKMSSDSEWNSFANLWRISDEDIMEEDVEESLTHKLMRFECHF